VEKAFHTNEDHGNLVVMLLPARTDTKWFHDYIYHKAEIRFIRGRLKFGDSKNSAPFPSMVVIYGQKGN
jgi:site-specific DNA-methyltransferase (adenine-specific)